MPENLWESKATRQAREDRELLAKREEDQQAIYDAADILLDDVLSGGLPMEVLKSIQSQLGPVALISTFPASYYQQREIERLERSIDGAGGGNE